ncbi:MAG: sulfotransferase [Polyangiaceae bacterium]|nr:sulfotransferase [Polyangiaceae bacterium]
MLLQRRTPPLLLRILDGVARYFPLRLISLDISVVQRLAERKTGLNDWGDSTYLMRLKRMTEAAAERKKMTLTGRFAYRVFLHWHACNRLRQVELLKQHPEIMDEPFADPIFIVGGYRTGTTHLHNLLCEDRQFRQPTTWELSFPISRQRNVAQDRRRRRRLAKGIFALNQFIMPDQADVHDVVVDGPEECHFLLENSALSMTEYISFLGYSYADWLLEQDLQSAYDDLRRQYQILAWQDRQLEPQSSPRPWVLKCPLHIWYLPELLKSFPDARILWTHRSMTSTLPSTCGLTAVTATKFFSGVDGAEVGAFWMNYYKKGFERAFAERARHERSRFIDVRLPDLAASPEETLDRIYQELGLQRSPDSRERVGLRLSAGNQAKDTPGKHRYTAEEFGLEPQRIREAFHGYQQEFGFSA